jgi:molybdopterin/thiamine biosynthesis adenylyltransferase
METLIHEELYRSKQLLDKMSNLDIVVCSAGAISSNLVDNLTRQGFEKISVIDFDRIEAHNKHTQIWTNRDIGQLKTAILKNHVFNSMNIVLNTISKKLDESNVKKLLKTNGLVIDGFDNVPSRKLVTEHCRINSLGCLHIGLSKDYAEIIWNESYRVPDETKNLDICEYPLARNIILLAVAVATECIISFLENKSKKNFVITLKDFKVMAV